MRFHDLPGCRIELVRLHLKGLQAMHEYSVQKKFYRFLEYRPHRTLNDTRDYLKKLLKISNSQTGHYWFIQLKENKKIIGTFGVVNVDQRRRSGEIGYGISPDYWGQGLFQEALALVLKHLFADLNFHRVAAKSQANNSASIRGLRKAGFKKEGVQRDFYLSYTGKRSDAVFLSMLRTEFLKSKKGKHDDCGCGF